MVTTPALLPNAMNDISSLLLYGDQSAAFFILIIICNCIYIIYIYILYIIYKKKISEYFL